MKLLSLFRRKHSKPDKAWMTEQFNNLRAELLTSLAQTIMEDNKKYFTDINELKGRLADVNAIVNDHEERLIVLEGFMETNKAS